MFSSFCLTTLTAASHIYHNWIDGRFEWIFSGRSNFIDDIFSFLDWLKISDHDFGIVEIIDVEIFWFHSTARPAYQRQKSDEEFIRTDQNRSVFSSSFENEFDFSRLYDNFQSFNERARKLFFQMTTKKNQLFHCSHLSTYKTVDNFMYGKICMFWVQREKNELHSQREN